MSDGRKRLCYRGDAEVWEFDLDQIAASPLSALMVTREERTRSEAFKSKIQASRFLASRSALRVTLAEVLDREPAGLLFQVGKAGRPFLADGPNFSVSHSDYLAVCAVADRRDIGVDVEMVRSVPEAADIIERWFSAAESAAYEERSRSESPDLAFARLWTRKEAYLKALGVGFTDEELVKTDPDPARWHTFELPVRQGFTGALVAAACEAGDEVDGRRPNAA